MTIFGRFCRVISNPVINTISNRLKSESLSGWSPRLIRFTISYIVNIKIYNINHKNKYLNKKSVFKKNLDQEEYYLAVIFDHLHVLLSGSFPSSPFVHPWTIAQQYFCYKNPKIIHAFLFEMFPLFPFCSSMDDCSTD